MVPVEVALEDMSFRHWYMYLYLHLCHARELLNKMVKIFSPEDSPTITSSGELRNSVNKILLCMVSHDHISSAHICTVTR